MLSQAIHHPRFPVANPQWGPEKVPLTMNVPVAHWSMLFRPQYWGFILLDVERAFAFYWNMKIFLLVAGVFTLLMLLTHGSFLISAFGAAWVLWSGFTQWWYSTPAMLPEMIGCLALGVVAAHYIARSRGKAAAAIGAALLTVCAVNFALCLYPPFQVPLAYLG